MTLAAVQAQAFKLANKKVALNPESAIVKAWLALKAQGTLIGVPATPEQPLDDGTVAQVFTSGAVLRWTGGDNVELV